MPSREQFAAKTNTFFSVGLGPELTVEMELVEVSESRERGGVEHFSLVFLAPPGAPAVQAACTVTHDDFPDLYLLLVPVGRRETGLEYEAVFNRVVELDPDHS